MILTGAAVLSLVFSSHARTPARGLSRRADSATGPRCVAEIPPSLLYTSDILRTKPVQSALDALQKQLKDNYTVNPDTFTLSIVGTPQ